MKRRLISIVTMLAMLATMISVMPIVSAEVPGAVYETDTPTIDGWRNIFSPDSTENAGGVWTDKSVVWGDTEIRGTQASDRNNFLVGLSAIGSKLKLTTETSERVTAATDTVFVLDDSNSMDDNNAREPLTAATNQAIYQLMQLNPDNRVAVVFYGRRAATLLPLDHYTAADESSEENAKYIEYQDGNEYKTVSGLKNGNNDAYSNSVDPGGATNQQAGMLAALNIFKNTDSIAKNNNIPIMIVMTDGAATVADSDYQNGLVDGGGSESSPEHVFFTQLTASYVKEEMKNVYENDLKTYTMGMYAQDAYLEGLLVDPAKYKEHTNVPDIADVLDYWSNFTNAPAGTVTVKEDTAIFGDNSIKVQKLAGYNLSMDSYVDASFEKTNASGLTEAFDDIYDKIQETSDTNFITRVTDDGSDYSGYVTFLDNIGEHMEVDKVRGIMLRRNNDDEDVLYTGSELANLFTNDPTQIFGDKTGTWTQMGNDLVGSIRTRLKLGNVSGPEDQSDEAKAARNRTYALINNAYQNQQFSYTSEEEFTNYFGWYSDEEYNCIAPWNDKADPDGTKFDEEMQRNANDNEAAYNYDELNYPGKGKAPVYLNKSYLYYNRGTGTNNTLYISVRVSCYVGQETDDKKPGDTSVAFAVPASLLPIIDYKVVDTETETTFEYDELAAPVTLFYELKPGVDENTLPLYGLSESGAALNTNKWNGDATAPVDKKVDSGAVGENTYSYFEPAVEVESDGKIVTQYNSKYYFEENTPIYKVKANADDPVDYTTDDNFELYTNTDEDAETWLVYQKTDEHTNDSNAYYYRLTYYEKDGDGRPAKACRYIKLNDHTLCGNFVNNTDKADTAAKYDVENGYWYIPKGAMKRRMSDYAATKGENKTETFTYSNMPFITEPPTGATGNSIYACAILGNNGMAEIAPNTMGGIVLSKSEDNVLEDDKDTPFSFAITSTNQGSNSAYLYKIVDNGKVAELTEELEFNNGEASLLLKAGESVYIGGLVAGTINITEAAGDKYRVDSVKIGNEVQDGERVDGLDVSCEEVPEIEFKNIEKTKVKVTINYLDDANHSNVLKTSYMDIIDAGEAYDYTDEVPDSLTVPETDGDKYVKVSVEGDLQREATGATEENDIVINVYYGIDMLDDVGDNLTDGDGIPDKYQVVVYFKANSGGSISGTKQTQVFTLADEGGNPTGTGTIQPKLNEGDEIFVQPEPDDGYAFIGWTKGETAPTIPDDLDAIEFVNPEDKITEVNGGDEYTFWASFYPYEKDPGSPTGGDEIPDIYQAVVTFKSEDVSKGTVGGKTTQVFTLKNDMGNYSKSGKIEPSLDFEDDADDIKTEPASGYKFSHWTLEINGAETANPAEFDDNGKYLIENAASKGSYVFVAHFNAEGSTPNTPNPPNPPNPPSRPSKPSKPSNTTPTRKDLLNTEDHFAYIIGYPDGDVRPEAQITRAEIATIFYRMLEDDARDEYLKKENSFSDVNVGNWYNNAISTLENADILHGYDDGSFRPDDAITRAELSKIAASFYDTVSNKDSGFTDIEGHWAEAFIEAAYSYGFIDGYPDNTFKPDQYITRAEAMKLVNRTLGRKPYKDNLLDDMIKWPDNADTAEWYYADVQEATNSHYYMMYEKYEEWTELRDVRDWKALEDGI